LSEANWKQIIAQESKSGSGRKSWMNNADKIYYAATAIYRNQKRSAKLFTAGCKTSRQ
jgi:hypothetical protein